MTWTEDHPFITADVNEQNGEVMFSADDVVAYLRCYADRIENKYAAACVDRAADALASYWIDCAETVRRVMDQ